MTWWDIGLIFVLLVVGSFIAGFIEAWLEQRKQDKIRKRNNGVAD